MLFFKTNAKTICCLLVALTLATVTIARQTEPSTTFIEESSNVNHKINGYKYLCMANQGNQYDLEERFNAFFASIGFTILTEDEEEELDEEEKKYVLYGTYEHNAVQNALNNTTLTLRNKDGKIIFSSTKESGCFVSVKRCAEKGADKIIQQIRSLNYSFDPTLVDKKKPAKTVESVETEIESTERVESTEEGAQNSIMRSENKGEKQLAIKLPESLSPAYKAFQSSSIYNMSNKDKASTVQTFILEIENDLKTAATWEDLEIINTKIKYLDQYSAIQKDLESTVVFLKENLNERVKAIEG